MKTENQLKGNEEPIFTWTATAADYDRHQVTQMPGSSNQDCVSLTFEKINLTDSSSWAHACEWHRVDRPHDNDFCRRLAHSLTALADKRCGWGDVVGGGTTSIHINEHTWTGLHVMRAFKQQWWNNLEAFSCEIWQRHKIECMLVGTELLGSSKDHMGGQHWPWLTWHLINTLKQRCMLKEQRCF